MYDKSMLKIHRVALVVLAAVAGCTVAPEDAGPFKTELAPDAKVWERTAAQELETYLGQVADGGRVTVEGRDDVVFHVGDTAFAKANGLSSAALQDEEWRIRSFGRDVVLIGGGTRGTLYAVYRFLEDDCGVRWWSDGEEDVPAAKPLAFAKLDRRGKPKFLYRDIYRSDNSDPRTAARNRVNGNGVSWIPPELGGGFIFGPPYHCHTWDRYLPFATYGKAHPEWYSMNKEGQRVGGQTAGQLCLANPELPEALAAKIEEYIAKGEKEQAVKGLPAPQMYDMSMNDNAHYCACPTCKASQDRRGVSGDQLQFENQVAGILAKKHPDLLFSVFAYFAGEAVPKDGTRAADNLLVKLCNTKQNMAAGIFEPSNRFMHDQVQKWKDYAKNLFVWDYSITFDRNTQGFPFASEFYLGERIRYYSDNGVVGMLIEHERGAETNDLYELKFWLQAKALEDPSRDPQALVREFMDGFYGAAGRKVLALRQELDRIRRERNAFVTWFPRISEFTFYTAEDLTRITGLWDEAEALVKNDPKRLRRVRRSRMGTDRLKSVLKRLAECRRGPEAGVSDRPYVNFSATSGAYMLHDGRFTVVDDAEASTGKAVRMPIAASPKHHVMPFQMGLYSQAEAKTYASKGWAKPVGDGYQWYDLGVVQTPKTPYYLFFTRSWLVQLSPGLPELVGTRCRIMARVKFAKDAILIDRTAFVPQGFDGADTRAGF